MFHGTRNLENRWILRLSPMRAYEVLIYTGIEICNRKVKVQPYDDVLKDEYEQFLEYIQMQKRFMYDKIKALTGVMPKQALSYLKQATVEMLPDPERKILKETIEMEERHLAEDMEQQQYIKARRRSVVLGRFTPPNSDSGDNDEYRFDDMMEDVEGEEQEAREEGLVAGNEVQGGQLVGDNKGAQGGSAVAFTH